MIYTDIKIISRLFQELLSGKLSFIILEDVDVPSIQVGDLLELEQDENTKAYECRLFVVGYKYFKVVLVLHDANSGIKDGYVGLSIVPATESEVNEVKKYEMENVYKEDDLWD